MKGHELFVTVSGYWPDDFSLQGSSLDEETGSFLCPALSSAWNEAERKAQTESEELLVWLFYQHLHTISKDKFRKGFLLSKLSELDESSILDQFRSSIVSDGYENLGLDI